MDTLVLDSTYAPITCITWQRALTLLCAHKVEVLEEHENRFARSVSLTFRIPAVIRFPQALRRRSRALRFSKSNVYERDQGLCQYCGSVVARSKATFDHVVPKALGGKTQWQNVVIACYACNQQKGCQTPTQAGMPLRSKPSKPVYLPSVFQLSPSALEAAPESWKSWLRVEPGC